MTSGRWAATRFIGWKYVPDSAGREVLYVQMPNGVWRSAPPWMLLADEARTVVGYPELYFYILLRRPVVLDGFELNELTFYVLLDLLPGRDEIDWLAVCQRRLIDIGFADNGDIVIWPERAGLSWAVYDTVSVFNEVEDRQEFVGLEGLCRLLPQLDVDYTDLGHVDICAVDREHLKDVVFNNPSRITPAGLITHGAGDSHGG